MSNARYWRPPFAALALIVFAAAWWSLVEQRPIPVLQWMSLGIHEAAHWAMSGSSQSTYFIAGSVGQVLVPLIFTTVAAFRRSWFLMIFCLIWAGSAASEVAIYIADAADQKLVLIGGIVHDWHWLLTHWGALENSVGIADKVRIGAGAIYAVALLVSVGMLIRPPRLPKLPGAGAVSLLARRSDQFDRPRSD